MPAFDDYYATARADYVYRSKQFATPANVAWVPSYDTINLNLALENEWTRIGAFCNNVLNNKDASVGINSRNINGEVVYQIQPRGGRRCGLRLSLKMNAESLSIRALMRRSRFRGLRFFFLCRGAGFPFPSNDLFEGFCAGFCPPRPYAGGGGMRRLIRQCPCLKTSYYYNMQMKLACVS